MAYDGLDRKIWGFFNKKRIDWLRFTGKSAVVGAQTVTVLMYDSAGKILYCTGTAVPTDATAGYAKGAIFVKTDAAAGTRGFYVNKGSISSCAFELGVAAVPGDITLATGSIIRGVAGVGAAYVAKTNAQILIGDGTNLNSVAVTGVLAIDNAGLTSFAAGAIMNADINANALIALSKLATQAANTIVMNATGGAAVPTAVALSANSLLYRGGGNISELTIDENRVAGRQAGGALGSVQVTGAMIAANAAIALTQLATQAANTVLANATAGAAVPTAVAVGTNEAVIRAAGNITPAAIAEARVLGRATGGALGAIQVTDEHVAAGAAIALSKLAAQAALTVVMNATNAAAVPTAVALAANQIFAVSAAPAIAALTINRKSVLGASATVLTNYALAAGSILTADANDLVAVAIAAGEVMVGATGPAIDGVALATGSILVGQTGATPVALAIAVKEVLYNSGAGVLAGLALAAGDLLTADASVLAKVSVAAGEVVVGATGPAIDGVALADNSLLIGATGATPVALAVAASRVVGRTAAGALDDIQIDSEHYVAGSIDPEHKRVLTKSTNNEDANIVVLAATLLQGYLEKVAGPTLGRNVTTDTAANIQAAFVATVGAYFDWVFANSSGQIMTLVGGVGVTIKGAAAVAAAESVMVRFINTGAGAIDAVTIAM